MFRRDRATSYSGKDHHAMAVVIELIHTATLLHDDVVDESATRRGQNTANELWGNAKKLSFFANLGITGIF